MTYRPEIIKQHRMDMGLSQSQLARKSKVDVSIITKMEKEGRVTLMSAKMVCDQLNLSLDELFI